MKHDVQCVVCGDWLTTRRQPDPGEEIVCWECYDMGFRVHDKGPITRRDLILIARAIIHSIKYRG